MHFFIAYHIHNPLSLSTFSLFIEQLFMEINAAVSPEKAHVHHYRSHHLPHNTSSTNHHDHHLLSIHSIIIIIFSVITIILILSILLIILILRRLKSSPTSKLENGIITTTNHHHHSPTTTSSFKFISHHSDGNFTPSPDLKGGGGCLSTGSLNLSNGGFSRCYKKGIQVFLYRELEIATDGFSEENVIGNGGFGVVYKGRLKDGTVAAIKKLHRDGKHGERAFRMEVDLLSRLHCPYLVELLGYCADQNHRLLIFEFIPNATLHHHLHYNNKYQPLDWITRLSIALDCARALEFLHEGTIPTVIHRDFKCTNILLDHNFRAKVSDFGLAKMGSDKINGQISTRVMGTTGYLAPEYASTGKLTTKSDVYSFGVVLLQLLTGRIPVDTRRPPGEHVLVSWALPRLTDRLKLIEMVDPILQGQYSKKDLVQVAAIAAVCVQPEADYRPLMTDVVQSLIPLVKSFSNYVSSGPARFLVDIRRNEQLRKTSMNRLNG